MSSAHFYHAHYDVYCYLPDGMVDHVLLYIHATCLENHIRTTGSMPFPGMDTVWSCIYNNSLRIQRGPLDLGVCDMCNGPIAQRLPATGKQLRKYFLKYSPRSSADEK